MGTAPGDTSARFRRRVPHQRVFVRVEMTVLAVVAACPEVLENVVRAAEMQTGMLIAAPLEETVVLRAGMDCNGHLTR